MKHTYTKSLTFQEWILNWVVQVAVSGIYEKMLIVLYFSSLLVCSAYCNKKPWIRWLKQQFKLEVLELGGLESEYQPGWVLMRIPFQVCRQLPSCCVLTWPSLGTWVEEVSRSLFLLVHQSYWTIIPLLWPHFIFITSSAAPSSSTVLLGVKASAYELRGRGNPKVPAPTVYTLDLELIKIHNSSFNLSIYHSQVFFPRFTCGRFNSNSCYIKVILRGLMPISNI